MFRWLYILPYLFDEVIAARRDARIRFLNAQVEILRRKLGGNRVIPSPDDRARLLAIGSEFNHDVDGVIGIVTRQTYSRWVVDQREGRKPRQVGRPKVARNVRLLIRRLAKENPGWGYRRILGELRKLRVRVGRSSIRRILKDAGLTPSPTRRSKGEETTWQKFIRLHMNTLVACDFFTKAVVTPLGVRTAYCLAFIHVGSRRVFLSPATYHPHGNWVEQQARNVLMWLDESNIEPRFILRDRDTKYSMAFDRVFQNAGMRRLRAPVLALDANTFAEAWIGVIKRECLNHFMCFSLGHLNHINQEFVRFHNTDRPHQGLGNRTMAEHALGRLPNSIDMKMDIGRVRCQQSLGGLLRHYYRAACLLGEDPKSEIIRIPVSSCAASEWSVQQSRKSFARQRHAASQALSANSNWNPYKSASDSSMLLLHANAPFANHAARGEAESWYTQSRNRILKTQQSSADNLDPRSRTRAGRGIRRPICFLPRKKPSVNCSHRAQLE